MPLVQTLQHEMSCQRCCLINTLTELSLLLTVLVQDLAEHVGDLRELGQDLRRDLVLVGHRGLGVVIRRPLPVRFSSMKLIRKVLNTTIFKCHPPQSLPIFRLFYVK